MHIASLRRLQNVKQHGVGGLFPCTIVSLCQSLCQSWKSYWRSLKIFFLYVPIKEQSKAYTAFVTKEELYHSQAEGRLLEVLNKELASQFNYERQKLRD